VVKAAGLAAGKGVIVAGTVQEALDAVELIMGKKAFGPAGDVVVVEEFLKGEEASFMAFTTLMIMGLAAPARVNSTFVFLAKSVKSPADWIALLMVRRPR
jgi:phosphoribosylamine-glycine ligase